MNLKYKNFEDFIHNIIKLALKYGATDVDAMIEKVVSCSLKYRLGKVENFVDSESVDFGLRVFIGKKQAIVSTSDFNKDSMQDLVKKAIFMAKIVPEDIYSGIGSSDEITIGNYPAIENFDSTKLTFEELLKQSEICEKSAFSVDGITNSEGVDYGWSKKYTSLGTSNGFLSSFCSSNYSLGISVIAGSGTKQSMDYDYCSSVFKEDIKDPSILGRRVGKWAIKGLNSYKVPTGVVPIIFSPKVSHTIISHFIDAINGESIANDTSFLKNELNRQIFPKEVSIIDDPFLSRGLKSIPFDSEGIVPKKQFLIKKGYLLTWLLNLRSARKLGMKSTGHAFRSVCSIPMPESTNVYVEPGSMTPEELISHVKKGFYVRELMGQGVNYITGQYSRGARGFWVENGELTFPVDEVTIAGNLKDMFKNITFARDLKFNYSINAPTMLINGMMLAGK